MCIVMGIQISTVITEKVKNSYAVTQLYHCAPVSHANEIDM